MNASPLQLQPQKPGTALKVVAIIQIIFGAIGLLGAPIALGVALFNAASKDPVQRKLHALLYEGPVAIWTYGQMVIGFALAIMLIAGGIGVLRAKMWGRTLGLVYAIGTLVLLVIGQGVMIAVVYPALVEQLDAHSAVERAGAAGALGGGIGGALFGAILPTILLVVLTRKSTRAQLD